MDFVADVEEIQFRDGIYKVSELTGEHESSEDKGDRCIAPDPEQTQSAAVSETQSLDNHTTDDSVVYRAQTANDSPPLFQEETSPVPNTVKVDEQVLLGEPLAPDAPVSIGIPVEAPVDLENPVAACEAEFIDEAPEPNAPIFEVAPPVATVGPPLVIDDSGLVPTSLLMHDVVSFATETDKHQHNDSLDRRVRDSADDIDSHHGEGCDDDDQPFSYVSTNAPLSEEVWFPETSPATDAIPNLSGDNSVGQDALANNDHDGKS